jgi:hypothetical protein
MDMETNDSLIYSHPKLKPRHFPMPSQRVEPHFCFAGVPACGGDRCKSDYADDFLSHVSL